MQPVDNLHRRYSLLFTLPSLSKLAVGALFMSLASALTFLLLNHPQNWSVGLPFYLGAFLLTAALDRLPLRTNPLASMRRLLSIALLSQGGWFLANLAGALVDQLLGLDLMPSFFVLGAMVAVGMRLLVLGAAFYDSLGKAFIASLHQPLILLLGLWFLTEGSLEPLTSPLLVGLSIPLAFFLYLVLVDRVGEKLLAIKSLRLLKAFLLAWAVGEGGRLEDYLEAASSRQRVKTTLLSFEDLPRRTLLVIPEIHPGPFYSVGSSSLPSDLHHWFLEKGSLALVAHGISGHDLNLPSVRVLRGYMASLEEAKEVGRGERCSKPIIKREGNATVLGIAFGKAALLIITLAPYGMEDFPIHLREEIERLALKRGMRAFVIDAHNCQGGTPSDEECRQVLKAADLLLEELQYAPQYPLKVGVAHSSLLGMKMMGDIGPAGLGFLLLEVEGERMGLVMADANNACRGIREGLINAFEGVRLELCTSDTHFNAAKCSNSRGYQSLGEVTPLPLLVEQVKELLKLALQELRSTTFVLRQWEGEAKVLGKELLHTFSKLVDASSSKARRGIPFILLTILANFLLVALLP